MDQSPAPPNRQKELGLWYFECAIEFAEEIKEVLGGAGFEVTETMGVLERYRRARDAGLLDEWGIAHLPVDEQQLAKMRDYEYDDGTVMLSIGIDLRQSAGVCIVSVQVLRANSRADALAVIRAIAKVFNSHGGRWTGTVPWLGDDIDQCAGPLGPGQEPGDWGRSVSSH